MAFLDHVNVSSPPARIGDAHVPFNKHWSAKPGICLHHGKTKIWNSQGEKPECVDAFSREARHKNPEAVVWRGDRDLHRGPRKVVAEFFDQE